MDTYTVRNIDEDGLPDEIVGRGFFHIERMDERSWYVDVGGCAFFFTACGSKEAIMVMPLRDHDDWRQAQEAGSPEPDDGWSDSEGAARSTASE